MIAAGFRTLGVILEYRADSDPEKPFVIFDDIDGTTVGYSYLDFDKSVNRTANMLQALGIGWSDQIELNTLVG